MASYAPEQVISVKHWNDKLFSFRTTREESLRFRNGEFIMVGLEGEPRPVMRAYSIASANHDDFLEFYSIKVPDGALTSRLQNIAIGDHVLIGKKPTGTLVTTDLLSGKNLFLIATGTGLAPFLSIIQDPDTYEQFERVILFHGVRHISELGYYEWLSESLPNHEYLGELISNQLTYYPSVTGEPFENQGRITDLLRGGKLCKQLGLPPLNRETDRAMLCGSPSMLTETRDLLDEMGFEISPKTGVAGDYVIERAFVE
uniref:ferredoxin--NADP(+) reductase n=1 Tax=uncultured Thiotrichaceae bacterium TaxID=298394 RepID=A0A6S6SBV6_9GAMM|nr:MAG: Ferredoxin--NADP(+) reductase (EC [uncultured Thiotrichaceae bacterium]